MLASLVILALLVIPLQIAAQNVSTLLIHQMDYTPIEPGGTLQLRSAYVTHGETVHVDAQWQDLGKAAADYGVITMYLRPEANQDRQMSHQFQVTTGKTELAVLVDTSQQGKEAVFGVTNSMQPAAASGPLNYTDNIIAIDLFFRRPISRQDTPSSATATNKRLVTAILRTEHETRKFDRSFEVHLGESVQVKTAHWTTVNLLSERQLHAWVSAKTHRLHAQEQRLRPSSVKVQVAIPVHRNLLCSRDKKIDEISLQFWYFTDAHRRPWAPVPSKRS